MSNSNSDGARLGDEALQTRRTCNCGRPTQPNANWCSAECYQQAVEEADTISLPCLNDHWWCPGPDGPAVDGEAWGGKCSDCYLQGADNGE